METKRVPLSIPEDITCIDGKASLVELYECTVAEVLSCIETSEIKLANGLLDELQRTVKSFGGYHDYGLSKIDLHWSKSTTAKPIVGINVDRYKHQVTPTLNSQISATNLEGLIKKISGDFINLKTSIREKILSIGGKPSQQKNFKDEDISEGMEVIVTELRKVQAQNE